MKRLITTTLLTLSLLMLSACSSMMGAAKNSLSEGGSGETAQASAQQEQKGNSSAASEGEFILPSDKQEITEVQLSQLNETQLKYAYAEIFARHGKVFEDNNYSRYFGTMSWYVPNPNYSESDLSDLEVENGKYIYDYMTQKYSTTEPTTQAPVTQVVTQIVTQKVYVQTPAPVQTPSYSGGGSYVIPDSSYRLISRSELAGLSSYQLRIARNEIYARHGRLFNDQGLQAYFNSQPWYNGYISPNNFSESLLNSTEKQNIMTIKSME